ncbi:uncharacterized protein LOC121388648 isoform X2 [Gigantopelta aegis]|uniref:uncharacterized protein LOC121388648 isoform X2 n=1 Tax=Gigantopelta aegis TaxID=1735272 RepID=UPI001B8888E0|nr:uncharacterized protein LOC121388648 isoform X2 [Gigantopelta aegis]
MDVLVMLGLLVLISSSHPLSIPELTTRGSHYEVGHDMGYTFKTEIDEYFSKSRLHTKLLPFVHTTQGSEVFTQVISAELYAVMKLQDDYSGCSDVYVNFPNSAAICHNEDGDPLVKDRGYLVHAIIADKQSGHVLENFTAYTYPGILPGNAFGFNSHGKVFTVNALYPRLVKPNQIPRCVLSRAMLSIKTRVELEDLFMTGLGTAYGFNVNFADLLNTTQVFVDYEITPQNGKKSSLVGRREIGVQRSPHQKTDQTGRYFHFNMFEILNVSQFSNSIVSSQHRKARAFSLPSPRDIPGALNILGDTFDAKYPIYRSPRPTDDESTEATAVFDVLHCLLYIYKTNPKSGQPLLTITLPRGPLCRAV